ncbi:MULTISPECIES: hypothetical protein [Kordiimonas]|jgi:hypothetical protein|uniref:hypothetical protein n=1 Tax=Kordiimonas TaxID=288021 RepID=UPI002580FEDE|nr:hypothetical protein [Kordiimonas sp. UBA4487]
MQRRLLYVAGILAMGALLAAAIFGSVGHLADPYAARGALLGTFLTMRYQHYVCRALLTWHVAVASILCGVFAAGLGRAVWHGPIIDFATELGEVLAATLLVTALMTASFYCLTLRQGRMA